MKRMLPLMFAVFVACSSQPSAPPLLVDVVDGGQTKAAFLADRFDRSDVVVWLNPESAGKTSDGDVVAGFRFVGWRAEEGARVQVHALTSGRFTKNERALKSQRIADLTISSGSQITIEQMSSYGVAPMSIRVAPYSSRV